MELYKESEETPAQAAPATKNKIAQ
jgi:hypothetical protein